LRGLISFTNYSFKVLKGGRLLQPNSAVYTVSVVKCCHLEKVLTSHISHLTSHISHLTSHIGTGKERGQGSSAVGGNGDMSKSAPVQESLRSSRQDGASKGNGKEGDVVVRPQEQRNLAGELVAPEFEQGKYSPEQDHTSHLSHLTSHI
jgi:hypothetical protein